MVELQIRIDTHFWWPHAAVLTRAHFNFISAQIAQHFQPCLFSVLLTHIACQITLVEISSSPLQHYFSQPQTNDAESYHGQVMPLDDMHDRVVYLIKS
jgi:hypothetical protein